MPELNGDHPATRADLHALEEKLERRLQEQKDELVAMIRETAAKQTESMHEFVRDAQTELLRGFQAFATGYDTRLLKLNAEVSILDTATERRLVALERRLLEIEMRLPHLPPPQSN